MDMLHHSTSMTKHGISLILSYGPLGLIRATNTLIGQNRICVDTGCIALNDHSEVEIVLSIRTGDTSETYRIPATVCGSDEHGVILQFRECAKATLDALLPYVTRH
jgi:hypothetical protein